MNSYQQPATLNHVDKFMMAVHAQPQPDYQSALSSAHELLSNVLPSVPQEERDFAYEILNAMCKLLMGQHIAGSLAETQQFADAANVFQEAVEAGDVLAGHLDKTDAVPLFLFLSIDESRLNVRLMRTMDHLSRLGVTNAQAELASAEGMIRDGLTALEAPEHAALPADVADMRARSLQGMFSSFYLMGTLVQLAVVGTGQNLQIAEDFFRRNDERLRRLGELAPPDTQSIQFFRMLLAFTAAARSRVLGEMAVTRHAFGEALEHFEASIAGFQKAVIEVPGDFPNAHKLREMGNNSSVATQAVITKTRELKRLADENELLKAKSTDAQQLSQRLNDMVHARVVEILRTAGVKEIRNDIDMTQQVTQNIKVHQENVITLHNRAMDEIIRRLDGIEDDRAKALKAEAEEARKETGVDKKIEKAVNVISGLGKLVKAGVDLIPMGGTIYALMSGLFEGIAKVGGDR